MSAAGRRRLQQYTNTDADCTTQSTIGVGDSCESIAAVSGVEVADLLEWNRGEYGHPTPINSHVRYVCHVN